MNLNQFKYLLAIYQWGSITKAAQELFVAAPSVSSAMKELEEELGYSLMTRHRNGVTFTEQGEAAIEIIKDIENKIDRLKKLDNMDETVLTGQVTLGGTPHFNSSLLLNLLLNMRQKYPQLKIVLKEGDSQAVLKMVAQGTVDLGVIMLGNVDESIFLREIRRNKLHFTQLFIDELCFVVRSDHPLAVQETVKLKDILQYPYYTYGEALTEKTLELFAEYNPEQEIVQIDDRDSLRRMILYSDGSTLMPLSNKQCTQEQFAGLTFLSIEDFSYLCKIGWLHNGERLSKAERRVVQELQDESLLLCR